MLIVVRVVGFGSLWWVWVGFGGVLSVLVTLGAWLSVLVSFVKCW